MTREEAEKYAENMTYREAIYNLKQAKSVPYRQATFIKVNELLNELEQEPMVEIDLYSVIKQKYIEREVLDNAIKEIKNAGYNNIVPIGEQIGDHRVKLCKVIEVDEVLKILEMNTGEAQSKIKGDT